MGARLLQVDARSSREFRDLITVLARIEKPIASQIRSQSRRVIAEEWKKGLTERASQSPRPRLAIRAIADTSRVQVTDRNVMLQAGAKKGRFRGGFNADSDDFWGVENGANREKYTTYQRKGKHGTHTVRRRTRRQLPLPRARGYVAGPTFNDLVPRVFRLWGQTAWRELHEQVEKVK